MMITITLSSHWFTVANCVVAMAASMLLVIASWNTEWDAATAKPKTADEANEEENPSEASSSLVDVCDTRFSTVMTCDFDRVVWPHMWIDTWTCVSCGSGNICDWLWLLCILLRRRLSSLCILLGHCICRLVWSHHNRLRLHRLHLRLPRLHHLWLHLSRLRLNLLCICVGWWYKWLLFVCLIVHLYFTSINRNYKFKNYLTNHFYI